MPARLFQFVLDIDDRNRVPVHLPDQVRFHLHRASLVEVARIIAPHSAVAGLQLLRQCGDEEVLENLPQVEEEPVGKHRRAVRVLRGGGLPDDLGEAQHGVIALIETVGVP